MINVGGVMAVPPMGDFSAALAQGLFPLESYDGQPAHPIGPIPHS